MKLEKDRLIAKVENLELSMSQMSEEAEQSLDKAGLSRHDMSQALGAGASS